MKKWLFGIALAAMLVLLVFVGVAFGRRLLTENELRQAGQAAVAAGPPVLGETQTLEVMPLYEAEGPDDLATGHGVAYLIRTDDTTILFDLGYNPDQSASSPLAANMTALGIRLDEIDQIVLSHRHPDHVGGLNWWNQKTFSPDGATQPSLGDRPIYVPEPMAYPGSSPQLEPAPVRLADGVATTGLIGYAQPFPIWLATPKGDEQALVVNVAGQGIVLITGCGHTGLDSLLARAEAVFAEPVVGVVGGLHFGEADAAALASEIDLLRQRDPVIVALSPHDSGPAARQAFADVFGPAYRPIQVGESITVPSPVAAAD